jgi:hypothetical protein
MSLIATTAWEIRKAASSACNTAPHVDTLKSFSSTTTLIVLSLETMDGREEQQSVEAEELHPDMLMQNGDHFRTMPRQHRPPEQKEATLQRPSGAASKHQNEETHHS